MTKRTSPVAFRGPLALPFDAAVLARVAAATAAMAAAVWLLGHALPRSVDALPVLALAVRVAVGAGVYGAAALALDIAGLGSAATLRLGWRPRPAERASPWP